MSRKIILKTETITKVIGSYPIISISMDLPGNISWRLAHLSDLITRHRWATHQDEIGSKKQSGSSTWQARNWKGLAG
jgi:hypothetical protein